MPTNTRSIGVRHSPAGTCIRKTNRERLQLYAHSRTLSEVYCAKYFWQSSVVNELETFELISERMAAALISVIIAEHSTTHTTNQKQSASLPRPILHHPTTAAPKASMGMGWWVMRVADTTESQPLVIRRSYHGDGRPHEMTPKHRKLSGKHVRHQGRIPIVFIYSRNMCE